jgi:ferritin
MIGQRMQDEMNEQIMHETASAYLYFSMAADFHAKGFDGMAQWMKAQAQEEIGHALRFFNHINNRGGRVELLAIEKPQVEWDSPLAAFKAALNHEEFITGKINELVKVAREENDNAAGITLQWFVNEQVEEEDSVSKVVSMLELIGDSGHGLLMADRELGQRIAGPLTTSEADAEA